ncbi:MAG: glycosyltransferase [Acidimicrobiales bacterium]
MTVVVHVLEALEGGTARHVSDLVTRVAGIEHHVALPPRRVGGVTATEAVAEMEAAGATIHRIDMRRLPLSPRNATALWELGRLVRRLRPDVIHGHSSAGGALARLAGLAGGSGGARSGNGGRPRRIYTPNGIYPGAPAAAAERGFGALTDRLVAVSESEARLVATRAIVPEERIVVIPNGIDLTPPAPGGADLRAQLGIDAGVALIGFVGRLVPQKAPGLMVEAGGILVHEGVEAVTVMIGSGPLSGELDRAIIDLSLTDRVRRVGHLDRATAVIDQLDVLVLPSLYEGCPYAPLEAMRAGVPVVLSDATGNRDVVDHGRTGLLFPPGDAASLAGAVSLLLSDAGLRARLTGAARQRLAADFDITDMATATERLYAEEAGSRA